MNVIVLVKKKGRSNMENMQQPSLFDPRKGRHKTNDWATSVAAAEKVAYRSGTQKYHLLNAFREAYPNDLTDEQAAEAACISLTSEYSKRCGELREDGVISVVWIADDVPKTRSGAAGMQRIVSIYIPEDER